MKYHGPLYGKLNRKYIRLTYNTDTVRDIESRLEQCRFALLAIATDPTLKDETYKIADEALTATAPKS